MKTQKFGTQLASVATALALLLGPGVQGSSHMDAPLITLDPAANTTDVYAFLAQHGGATNLTVALAVYPFEEPGIGPNKYNFDENVLYQIHVATSSRSPGATKTDLARGVPTLTYYFQFSTRYKATGTILQSYLGVITNVDDEAQNLTQTYTVHRVNHHSGKVANLGSGMVPPNNQGNATPFYNGGDSGENAAKEGVGSDDALDRYTAQSVASLDGGYRVFAGQRDDGFYGDIQAIFDLLTLRGSGKDSQQGFNVHTIVLEIPLDELGTDRQVVGVYATTSRRQVKVLRDQATYGVPALKNGRSFGLGTGNRADGFSGRWVQVGRQGNPLFCEALVALADKDLYNRTTPAADETLFKKYALTPELAHLLNALVFHDTVAPETNRTDLVGIFIPDLIRVDLSTGPARLAGGGYTLSGFPNDDSGFSRLSIFGGDTLHSQFQTGFGGGTVPGGWPNGRRFGDDVVDIAVTAVASDLRTSPPTIRGPYGDNVNNNDITYNKVFPYAATPLNGRNHNHQ